MKKYVMHDIKWLKQNAFMDTDKDWWETEKLRDEYNINDNSNPQDEFCNSELVGQVITEAAFLSELDREENDLTWAVKEIVTPETHPEHFL